MFRKFFPIILTACAMGSLAPLPGQTPSPTVGTWVINVYDNLEPNKVAFRAIHTYHSDGGITEGSSLLPSLAESPAQGQWKKDGDRYNFVFQLFSFDKGEFNGYIRVRGSWLLVQGDRTRAEYTVDVIDKDGKAELAVARGFWDAVRLKVDSPIAVAVP